MRHVIFGTAGHIDHGKTALVRALTGTDCDRLPEERRRGITIDLGFAQLDDADTRLHFIDVPGHERLVHTMIAGAAGIDLALLVVAADEGIMPQTREHLDVIRLMGVPGGAVALTKTDLVDDELAALAVEEVRELLAGTPFAEVPVVPVSARTGEGVEVLRAELLKAASSARPRRIDDRPFRIAVDRVFTMTGVGTVVTGTSLWGRFGTGGELRVMPGETTVRVRRLQVHGSERALVEAGERVALNLAGISRDDLRRGDQLISLGPWEETRRVTARVEVLPGAPSAIDEGEELEVHALASRVPARVERLSRRPVEPGTRAVAQLALRQPMLLFPGDRLVLRRPAPVNTFAGGQVLDAHLARWRRRDSAMLEELSPPQRGAWPRLLADWIVGAGLAGVTPAELAGRLGVLSEAVEAPLGRLMEQGEVTALGRSGRVVATARLEELSSSATAELGRRLEGAEVSSGVPARDFIAALLPRWALDAADVHLEELRRRGVIQLAEGRVLPPGSDRHMTDRGAELARAVSDLYRETRFDAPSPAAVAERLSARPATVEGICRFLVERGELVRLDGKYLLHRSVLDDVVRELRASEEEEIDVGTFKARFGLTRKLAIPLLEWLDSERVTRRVGDRRKILRR